MYTQPNIQLLCHLLKSEFNFPFQGVFFPPHTFSSQVKSSEASILTSHDTARSLNELPRPSLSPCSTCNVSTISPDGRVKEKSQKYLSTELHLPTYLCQWAWRTQKPASDQWKHKIASLHFTAVSVALQLSSFRFYHKIQH